MNLFVVISFIANQLNTIIRTYSLDKNLLDIFRTNMDLQDSVYVEPGVEDYILDITKTTSPLLTTINQNIIYSAVASPECIFVIGPVYITDALHIAHNLSDIPYDLSTISSMNHSSVISYLDYILLLHNLFHSEQLTKRKCILMSSYETNLEDLVEKNTIELSFNNREYNQKHNSYEQERRLMSSIEQGDLLLLQKSWEEDYDGNFGINSKDSNRNAKNLAIAAITLVTRAAIKGGILPEIAFSLCDTYMMQIEESKNTAGLESIIRGAEYRLAKMVYENNMHKNATSSSESNPIVERCKDYISSHLQGKITVQEIAEEFKMNPNYLSDLFKKHEGISPLHYIMNEKISLAKNLLTYSKYSYSEIATYLGFSSQSHLGKQFKAMTGMTLREYRNRFWKKDVF